VASALATRTAAILDAGKAEAPGDAGRDTGLRSILVAQSGARSSQNAGRGAVNDACKADGKDRSAEGSSRHPLGRSRKDRDVQPLDCQPDGNAADALGTSRKSRIRPPVPQACDGSPEQGMAWQTESETVVPMLPATWGDEPQ
jgi:hypothetical protein